MIDNICINIGLHTHEISWGVIKVKIINQQNKV